MSESISRRSFVGALAGASALQPGCSQAQRKPNVLFVFSDQHRACSMPGEPFNDAEAPNLARLASEGVTFRNCISNYPVCSPYRGILLSGRWPYQTGIIDNNFSLKESETSLGEAFRAAGYRTGYIGKWHLDAKTPGSLRPEGEARHGFGFWRAWFRTSQHMKGSYTFDPRSGERIEPKGYNATLMTDQAVEFIAQLEGEDPWMLVVSVNPPHPLFTDAPPHLMKRYRDAQLQLRPNGTEKLQGPQSGRRSRPVWENLIGYNAHITAVDAEIGRLLDTLDETGQAGDTIVVYTSDHGEMMGSHNWMGKRLPYEESAKVPFVARFPGTIPTAGVSDVLLSAIDLYPTLCGLAGLEAPAHCEGSDLSAALRGESFREPEHSLLMHQNIKGVNVPIYRGIRTTQHTYAVGEEGRWLLFDNQEDPYQQHNLAKDPSRFNLMHELDGEILDYLKRAEDPYPFEQRIRERVRLAGPNAGVRARRTAGSSAHEARTA